MVKTCVTCMSDDYLMPLSDKCLGILEPLVTTAVNLCELRDLKPLICKDCQSFIRSLINFRKTAITVMKHLLHLSQNKLIEPKEVLRNEEPYNIYMVEKTLDIELEPECMNKIQDEIKSEALEITENWENVEGVPTNATQVISTEEEVNNFKPDPLAAHLENTAVFTHSIMPRQNQMSKPHQNKMSMPHQNQLSTTHQNKMSMPHQNQMSMPHQIQMSMRQPQTANIAPIPVNKIQDEIKSEALEITKNRENVEDVSTNATQVIDTEEKVNNFKPDPLAPHPENTAVLTYSIMPHQNQMSMLHQKEMSAPHQNQMSMSHQYPMSMPHQNQMSMPHQNPMSMPHQNQMSMPHQNQMSMPHQNQISMPHQNQMSMPHQNPMSRPHQNQMSMPHQNPMSRPHQNQMSMPHQNPMTMSHQNPMSMPHHNQMSMPHQNPTSMPHQSQMPMQQTQTTNIASIPKIQLVPQNRLIGSPCPPLHYFNPQFIANNHYLNPDYNFYNFNTPLFPPMQPVQMQDGLNVTMAPPTNKAPKNKAPKNKAPKSVAPKPLKERNSEPRSKSNNNNPEIVDETLVEPRWYTRVFAMNQIFWARSKERARKEFVDAPHKCTTCILVFSSQEEVDAHAKEHVLAPGQLPCSICALPIRSEEESAHMSTHTRRHQCARCAFSTERIRDMEAHDCSSEPAKPFRMKRKKYVYSFRCRSCAIGYTTQAGLDAHNERTHRSPNATIHKCDACTKEFTSKAKLSMHMFYHKGKGDAMDSLRPELFCVECNKGFISLTHYRTHRMSLKHFPQEKKFECDLCHKKYRRKGEIGRHIQQVHNKKPTKCKECGKSLESESTMRRHMRLCPKDQKGSEKARPHVCHLCGKAFTVTKSLEEHIIMHSGLRPHKCQLCPATFTYKAALFTHNRLKHLKIKRRRDIEKVGKKDKGGRKKDAAES